MKPYLLISPMLVGCTGLNTTLPEVPEIERRAEQARFETAAFEEMAALRARLEPVAPNILLANQELCEKTHVDIGVITQTIDSYPKNLRDGARRELGLGDDPSIIYVRPDSAAATSGLKLGDKLITEQGDVLASPSDDLSNLLESNSGLLRSRLGVREQVTLSGTERCNYKIKLKMSPAINAYANGKSIVVTAGMMNWPILLAMSSRIIRKAIFANPSQIMFCLWAEPVLHAVLNPKLIMSVSIIWFGLDTILMELKIYGAALRVFQYARLRGQKPIRLIPDGRF